MKAYIFKKGDFWFVRVGKRMRVFEKFEEACEYAKEEYLWWKLSRMYFGG